MLELKTKVSSHPRHCDSSKHYMPGGMCHKSGEIAAAQPPEKSKNGKGVQAGIEL